MTLYPQARPRSLTYLDRLVTREQLISLLLLDAVGNDNVLPRNPIDRGGNLVLGADLQRVDHPQELVDVPPRRGRVGDDEPDDLFRVDDEDASDGQRETEGVDVGGVEGVEHVVGGGNLALLVTDDGELRLDMIYVSRSL